MMNVMEESNRQHADRLPSSREQLYEVSAFLFLIVPSMILSMFVVRQGGLSFVLTAVSVILRDMALVMLILFFFWRNRESLAQLGWSFGNGWKEVILGIALFIPLFFSAGLLDRVLQSAGFSAPATAKPSFLQARGWGDISLAFVLVLVVAIAEETIFRGYLLRRFQGVRFSLASSAILSAVVFSLGHGYEGASGMLTVGFMGVVFAAVYIWRKSLVAPMVMHFCQDFLGVVLVPLLSMNP